MATATSSSCHRRAPPPCLPRSPTIESTRLALPSSGFCHAPLLPGCAQRHASSPKYSTRSAPATVPASPGQPRACHLQGARPSPCSIHKCHHLSRRFVRALDWCAGRRRRSTLCPHGAPKCSLPISLPSWLSQVRYSLFFAHASVQRHDQYYWSTSAHSAAMAHGSPRPPVGRTRRRLW
jgi:hypothetical protein